MKKCLCCNQNLNISDFGKDLSKDDSLSIYCKKCARKKSKERQRSRVGLIARIYGNQKTNSKRRGHKPPEYGLSELREFLLSSSEYHSIYDKWVLSGYKRGLSPSCDRINNSLGYCIDNIRIMTWDENKTLGHIDVSNGTVKNSTLLNGGHKEVSKYDMDGNFICKYISLARAAKENSVHQANITKCLQGKIKQTGGFIWK